MKKKASIFLLILIIFTSGFLLGFFSARVGVKSCREAEISEFVNAYFFRLNGVVTEISGRVLTIFMNDQVAKISVPEEVPIRTREIIKEEISSGDPLQEEVPVKTSYSVLLIEILFEDIKIGDSISVFAEQKENMELEASSVYIDADIPK